MNHLPEYKLTLPWPPSTNQIWRTVKINGKNRTLLSEKARHYRVAAWEAVRDQLKNRPQLEQRLRVHVFAYPPDYRRRDLDNILKCTFDALTHSGVWVDDALVDYFSVQRCEPCTTGKLDIRIAIINNEDVCHAA